MKSFASRFSSLSVAAIILFATPMAAQNSGSIQGTAVDPQGKAIPGATVRAIDQDKGTLVREEMTGPDGTFLLQPLQPGTYSIRVSAPGMKDLESKDIVLDSRQVLSLGELKMALRPHD